MSSQSEVQEHWQDYKCSFWNWAMKNGHIYYDEDRPNDLIKPAIFSLEYFGERIYMEFLSSLTQDPPS